MRLFIVLYCLSIFSIHANGVDVNQKESIAATRLQNFNTNSDKVKKLINSGLELATKNLNYRYGSADPKAGGMDCSGTVYYLLNALGISEVPRSSDLQFDWVKQKGHFYPVTNQEGQASNFLHLHPGDLLFWNGTYEIKRVINVTHVMIYIGKDEAGKMLMVGASDGRTFRGRKIYGVSVFDFQLPEQGSKSHFLGYGCIPQVNC